MTDKADYYAVLGVNKGDALEDIKKAYQKKVMKFHPDRMVNKSDAEKASAHKAFQLVEEAYVVLSDAHKRATYDSYGHAGLANLASGNSAQTGRSYADLTAPVTPMRPVTPDDAFDHFDRLRRDRAAASPAPAPADTEDNLSPDDARAARRAAREARKSQPPGSFADSVVAPPRPTPAPVQKPAETAAPAPKTPAGSDFDAARRDTARLKENLTAAGAQGADIPLEALVRFRQELNEMLTVVDRAIAKAKKPGPSV